MKSFLKTGKTTKAQMKSDKKSKVSPEVKKSILQHFDRLHKNFERTLRMVSKGTWD